VHERILDRMITQIVDFLSAGGWVPVSVLVALGVVRGVNPVTSGITSHAYNKTRPR
jgi:hypothetical protein